VATNRENLYANYTLDDWNWEFLKRNPRYKKAYKAVQWLKARLDKKKPSLRGHRLPHSDSVSDLHGLTEATDGSGVTNGMENNPYISTTFPRLIIHRPAATKAS
jgi:hypothetical protein